MRCGRTQRSTRENSVGSKMRLGRHEKGGCPARSQMGEIMPNGQNKNNDPRTSTPRSPSSPVPTPLLDSPLSTPPVKSRGAMAGSCHPTVPLLEHPRWNHPRGSFSQPKQVRRWSIGVGTKNDYVWYYWIR